MCNWKKKRKTYSNDCILKVQGYDWKIGNVLRSTFQSKQLKKSRIILENSGSIASESCSCQENIKLLKFQEEKLAKYS